MQSQFTLQYGEFVVADYLSKNIKEASVFIPTSAQEKGIDLMLYRFADNKNYISTIQVKMSRAYYYPNKKYQGTLWFNRFTPQDNADWFILVGIYAKFPEDPNSRTGDIQWDHIMLAFNNQEMKKFMNEVKLKGDSSKEDKMFGFGFNGKKEINQTRCYYKERDMKPYLIENRIDEIKESLEINKNFKRKKLIEDALNSNKYDSKTYQNLLKKLDMLNIMLSKIMNQPNVLSL